MSENQQSPIIIFWYRRDLRTIDNKGLFEALNSGFQVLPIFIFDPNILTKIQNREDSRVSFIHQELEKINLVFKGFNSSLKTFYDNPLSAFQKLTKSYKIKAVYTNSDYEPYALDRDKQIGDFLSINNIGFNTFKDHVIFEKDEIVKADGKPYTVYTPYKNRWISLLDEKQLEHYPCEKKLKNLLETEYTPIITLNEMGFKPSKLIYPDCVIQEQLVQQYDAIRNFPKYSTSKLGIHLRFGTISIRNLAKKAKKLNETYLSELVWRDFFQMIIFHFPHSARNSFKPAYDRIPWRNDEKEFEKWCKGETGFPLVDAGMRELNATGFMHNRVRMLTASFLCKNLLIDWRWGEAYFAEKLLDFDLAANVGNWQWAAGSGCDAAPYFRVFSPVLQTEKFDKDYQYIKKWVPEYGTSAYCKPMTDAKSSAKTAIETYKKALS